MEKRNNSICNAILQLLYSALRIKKKVIIIAKGDKLMCIFPYKVFRVFGLLQLIHFDHI